MNRPARIFRRIWPRHNELMRPADWVEAALLLAVITLALLLLPVALAAGSETYANQTRLSQEQSATRHPATATLLQDAPPAQAGSQGEPVHTRPQVSARWTVPGDTEHTGTVPADAGAQAGTTVPIWLDESGNAVNAPRSGEGALLAGIATATMIWVGGIVALTGFFLLARAGLNRSRSTAWQRNWTRFARDRTRRH